MTTDAGAADRQARLMSLLRDLVREHGEEGAAEFLEVDRRTLVAGAASGVLSRRMRAALDRVMMAGDGSEAAGQRERIAALDQGLRVLEDRVSGLEMQVREGLEGSPEEPVRTEHLEELSRRLRLLELGASVEVAAAARDPETPRPGVVTEEPSAGEGAIYEESIALVDEWRRLRMRAGGGTRLERARARERVMELEIAMLAEHDLTLPPEIEPLHPSRRAVQVDWRERELEEIRAERFRAQVLSALRRVLTLGIWR